MVFQELFKIWASEKIDRQVLSKIPYAILISAALLFHSAVSLSPLNLLKFLILLLLTYLILTYFFTYKFWNIENELILLTDIKEFRKKLREIFEEKRSIFEDIELELSGILLFLGSGIAFSLFLIFLSLIWLKTMKSEIIVVTITATSLLFISYDITRSDFLEEIKESNEKVPFIEDIVEKYIFTNFIEKLPGTTTLKNVLFKILYRLLSPPMNFPIPKITFDILMIYRESSIDDLLERYTNENNNKNFYFKHMGGLKLEEIRRIDAKGGGVERVSLLIERSPLENFPYLFDPNYEYGRGDSRKWCMFAIVENNDKSEKVLGYVFIHIFKGVCLKRKLRKTPKRPIKVEGEPKIVYFFIFLGSRGEVSYLKREIVLRAPKFDPNLVNLEIEENLSLPKY